MKKYLFLMAALASSALYSWQDQEVHDLYKEIPELVRGYQARDEKVIEQLETITRKYAPESSANQQAVSQKTMRQQILTVRKNVTKVVNVGCVLVSAAIFIKYAPIR